MNFNSSTNNISQSVENWFRWLLFSKPFHGVYITIDINFYGEHEQEKRRAVPQLKWNLQRVILKYYGCQSLGFYDISGLAEVQYGSPSCFGPIVIRPKEILHHCETFLTVGESAWHRPPRKQS